MADWLKSALSERQQQEDIETAKKRSHEDKITALKTTAVTFINESAIYDIIAQYFTDLGDIATANIVIKAKKAPYIPIGISVFLGTDWPNPDLRYIDTKKEYENDPDGPIPHITGSGNEFHSKINTSRGTKICDVSIAVFLTHDQEYTFTPIILIALDDDKDDKNESIFINTSPDTLFLYDWLKEKTVLYLNNISLEN